MRIIGDNIIIQRGEDFTIDFEVKSLEGHPLMLLKQLTNPFLVITVTNNRYENVNVYKQSWWLDIDNCRFIQKDGTVINAKLKRFTSTEPLSITIFDAQEVVSTYVSTGRLVLDKSSDFDITNFLFYTTDEEGNNTYKYIKDYTVADGSIATQKWEEYSGFRVIKSFYTSDWIEQSYWIDMKVLSGETLDESLYAYMKEESYEDIPELPWTEEIFLAQLERVVDVTIKEKYTKLYESNAPLVEPYDSEQVILYPKKISISSNIQR